MTQASILEVAHLAEIQREGERKEDREGDSVDRERERDVVMGVKRNVKLGVHTFRHSAFSVRTGV